MATRQYIGARYVTKIYENSLDPSSAEWEASVNYEPLTLVTYNNGSYLSKKEVPGSVGDPASNPSYWVQTGFYNGQIAALDAKISNLNGSCYVMHPTGDTTDRSTELRDALDDYSMILFTEGDYYFSSTVSIPSGAKITGCGLNTVLKFASGATGYMFDVDNDVIIDSIKFDGGLASKPSVYDNRGAISFTNKNKTLKVINCEFYGFGGYAIYIADVGYGHLSSLSLVNSYFRYNYAGIYFDHHAEYALIGECTFIDNAYGAYIGGGNNQFNNCGFNHNSIGVFIDGAISTNNGHGIICGCSFNHNTSHALKMADVTLGYNIVNCSFYAATTWEIELDNSVGGISVKDCMFGGSAKIWIHNASIIFFENNNFNGTPSNIAIESGSTCRGLANFLPDGGRVQHTNLSRPLGSETVPVTYVTNSCVADVNGISMTLSGIVLYINFSITINSTPGSNFVTIGKYTLPDNRTLPGDQWIIAPIRNTNNDTMYSMLIGILANGDIQIYAYNNGVGTIRMPITLLTL